MMFNKFDLFTFKKLMKTMQGRLNSKEADEENVKHKVEAEEIQVA